MYLELALIPRALDLPSTLPSGAAGHSLPFEIDNRSAEGVSAGASRRLTRRDGRRWAAGRQAFGVPCSKMFRLSVAMVPSPGKDCQREEGCRARLGGHSPRPEASPRQ